MANLVPVEGVLIDELVEQPFDNGRAAISVEGLALPVGLNRDYVRFNVGAIAAAAEACDIRALYVTSWQDAGTTNMAELRGLSGRRDFFRAHPKSDIVAPYFATTLGDRTELGRSAAIHINTAEISNRALNGIDIAKLPPYVRPEDRWALSSQIWYDSAVRSGLFELGVKAGLRSAIRTGRLLKKSGMVVSFLPTHDDLQNEVVFGFLKKSLSRENEP